MTEQPQDQYAWTDLNIRLEDVWKAHKAVDDIEDERDLAVQAAIAQINKTYTPLILEAKSVDYEVQARALRAGFGVDQLEEYLEDRHPDPHTPC